jgi:hypothetical protein
MLASRPGTNGGGMSFRESRRSRSGILSDFRHPSERPIPRDPWLCPQASSSALDDFRAGLAPAVLPVVLEV